MNDVGKLSPLSFLSAIGFCFVSFSIFLIPFLIIKLLLKIDISIEYSIWMNIPGFIIPSWLIYKNSNFTFSNLFKIYKKTSINLWIIVSITSLGLVIFLGEIENYILFYYPISDEFYIIMELVLTSTSGMIAATFMAPITEEIFFRGSLLPGLSQKYSKFNSILISALLFGLIHLNPWQFIPAFFIGLFLGWLYLITKNIYLCIFIHALNNGTAVFLEAIGIEIKGFVYDPILGIDFQPFWFTLTGLIIFIVGVFIIHNKLNNEI